LLDAPYTFSVVNGRVNINGESLSREQLATEAKVTRSYAGRILRLAALAPDIVDGIVRDRLVVDRSPAFALPWPAHQVTP
jgi:hypothetical protein